MKFSRYIKSLAVAAICGLIFTTGNMYTEIAKAQPVSAPVKVQAVVQQQGEISPLAVVNSPKMFLNKKITMRARFDKFSTLGLDYKPAMKSSDSYISFMVKRDDTVHDIPLSEMKLFLKREVAEKFIDLKTDDEIKIVGTVFSDALGDAWVDVEQLIVTKKTPDKDGVK